MITCFPKRTTWNTLPKRDTAFVRHSIGVGKDIDFGNTNHQSRTTFWYFNKMGRCIGNTTAASASKTLRRAFWHFKQWNHVRQKHKTPIILFMEINLYMFCMSCLSILLSIEQVHIITTVICEKWWYTIISYQAMLGAILIFLT